MILYIIDNLREEKIKRQETNENVDSRLNKNSGSVNKARNKELASKLANLLEGLEFPSTKNKIKDYIRKRSQMLQQIHGDAGEATYGSDNGVLWIIENNLSSDNRR